MTSWTLFGLVNKHVIPHFLLIPEPVYLVLMNMSLLQRLMMMQLDSHGAVAFIYFVICLLSGHKGTVLSTQFNSANFSMSALLSSRSCSDAIMMNMLSADCDSGSRNWEAGH